MGRSTARALGIPACLASALALLFAPQANAASPLKIREVFPGSPGAGASAEFVELQMTAAGQSDIDGQVLRFYSPAGTESSSFTIPSDVDNGASQRSVLLATSEASAVGATSPDFSLTSADRMEPAGGAICLTGTGVMADCLSWGPFPIPGPFDPQLVSDPQSANASALASQNAAGFSWTRDITRGCATLLDALDDTRSSAADFDPLAPSPRSNSVTPTEIRCPPSAAVTSGPDSPTNKTNASLSYTAITDESVTFQCHLDSNPSSAPPATAPAEGEWEACNAPPKAYSGLRDGFYRFWVRAKGENPSWGPHASRSWQIDATAPQTQVTSSPPEPSSGFEAAFGFSSTEGNSSFRCQLDAGAIQVCANNANSGSKSYFNLTDGTHVFRVWAADNAGNQDPSPAEKTFTIFTPLGDLTAPDTSIISAPQNPSPFSSAFFAYASSEPGSTFQCRLGQAAFAACPEAGVKYEKLKNGAYTFEARAVDRAGNVDSIPASISWRVSAALPNTTITKGPAGRVFLAKGKKAKRTITVRFKADEAGSSFRCALNGAKAKPCSATKVIVLRKPGRYRFEVYAVDVLGNAETTPARRIWKVQTRGGNGLF